MYILKKYEIFHTNRETMEMSVRIFATPLELSDFFKVSKVARQQKVKQNLNWCPELKKSRIALRFFLKCFSFSTPSQRKRQKRPARV